MSKGKALALATAAVFAAVLALGSSAANAGYPFTCPKQRVLVVQYDTGVVTTHTTVQAAVVEANGTDAGSSVGDTVVVCPGTFSENVVVPLMDAGGLNTNITIRSWNGADNSKLVGSGPAPVIDIDANGVTLGGPGLGLTITGTSPTGIQVGDPMEPDPDEDDDQEITECEPLPPPGECPDEELPPLTPINVSLIGNRVLNLASSTATVTGISVTNSNNTLTFRNLVQNLSAGAGDRVYGIRYSDTNSNTEILENAVLDVSQAGGTCDGSLATPMTGAIGIAVQEEALDALAYENKVEEIISTCTAIGFYSDAYGGLENDRNGQQIPIVTDVVDNRIKKVVGAAGTCTSADQTGCRSANVVIAPSPLDTEDDETGPSSFRVLANDLDDGQVAVAVLAQMAPYSYIKENDFDHNQIGVWSSANTNTDATNNWWGCVEGPASGKKECATIAGVVFYQPWLKQHVDHAGDHAGEHAGHG